MVLVIANTYCDVAYFCDRQQLDKRTVLHARSIADVKGVSRGTSVIVLPRHTIDTDFGEMMAELQMRQCRPVYITEGQFHGEETWNSIAAP